MVKLTQITLVLRPGCVILLWREISKGEGICLCGHCSEGTGLKRILLVVLSILLSVPIALGAVVGVAYYTTGENSLPKLPVAAMGQQLAPAGYSWQAPVFAGVTHRQFSKSLPEKADVIGRLETPELVLDLPGAELYTSTASVAKGGETLWQGDARQLGQYQFIDGGTYTVQVDCQREEVPGDTAKGFGTISYLFAITVAVQPECTAKQDTVGQGDVFALKLSNLATGTVPTAQSELGKVYFLQTGNGQMVGYLPVTYDSAVGSYQIEVSAGRQKWTLPVRVTEARFSRQDLSANGGRQDLGEATSPEAYEEFEAQVPPMYEVADGAKYWEGRFFQPVEGFITAEYGLYRADGRNPGIDIEANEGTEVVAPNDGRVIYARYLLNTGNTLIIEHGGGLKSIFTHMNSIVVEEGAYVQRGNVVGSVGATGDAMEPSLHYEIRLGDMPLNPQLFFNGISGVYTFEQHS